jgi:hypothetical protein
MIIKDACRSVAWRCVDWFFTDRLRARIEILHDDYGREDTISYTSTQYSSDWTDTTLRGGLLFQF